MDNYALVRPEHLNHHGFLFGGVLLKWVDEFAWLAASLDFPQCTLVTVAMDNIQFRQRVQNGSILRFHITPLRLGDTSVTYTVEVQSDEPGSSEEKRVFSTTVTFVRVDSEGRKVSLPAKPSFKSRSS
ncbi:MAG: acyl-CoA thioesterase [bacterium]|nr:acyl-CoA thioesterase [bacterium]